uniref:Auxin responsive SAUR protein n=1 Tax=Tanacetum cinerariifolium TaxID=118510 RepID=A0A6L2JXH5_TANCI|nr:auxin responsive SAUR protein [Tanacetum cinerariifolium]
MGLIRFPSLVSSVNCFGRSRSLHERNYQSDVPKGHLAVYVGETEKRRLNTYRSRYYRRDVPKGHLAVYVGQNEKRRFVVPIAYLEQPLFQNLLRQSEDEFGFDHSMGSLTISCQEDEFFEITAQLYSL